MDLKITEMEPDLALAVFEYDELYRRTFYPYKESPSSPVCYECHTQTIGSIFSLESSEPPLLGKRYLVCQKCLGKFIEHYENLERKYDEEIILKPEGYSKDCPIIIE